MRVAKQIENQSIIFKYLQANIYYDWCVRLYLHNKPPCESYIFFRNYIVERNYIKVGLGGRIWGKITKTSLQVNRQPTSENDPVSHSLLSRTAGAALCKGEHIHIYMAVRVSQILTFLSHILDSEVYGVDI